MRTQLLFAGVATGGVGAIFILLQVPIVALWGIPFAIVGALMAVASPFLDESHGPVEPPEGYRFCVYCSTIVPVGQKACDRCGGAQPAEGA